MENILSVSEKVKQILGLTYSLAGVKFLFSEEELPSKIEKLNRHCCCLALMKRRQCSHVIIEEEGIACPANAAAFIIVKDHRSVSMKKLIKLLITYETNENKENSTILCRYRFSANLSVARLHTEFTC
jgi:uncharacterized protein (DUF169 family)